MIKGVVINMIKLLHYGMLYLSTILLDKLIEYRNSYKRSYDYVHKPRYIKPGRDTNMINNDTSTSKVVLPSRVHTENRDIVKWDKKSAPYCETP